MGFEDFEWMPPKDIAKAIRKKRKAKKKAKAKKRRKSKR